MVPGVALWVAAIAPMPVLLILGGCSPAHQIQARHAASPSPAAAALAPSPAPTPSPMGRGAVPGAAAVPSPNGLPHLGQDLLFTGTLNGTVSDAEVKQCGVYGGQWSLQMSNMALGGGNISLSLYLDSSYVRPGSYMPRGSLMVIMNEQSSFYALVGGTVGMTSTTGGSADLTFQGPGSLHVTGSWACGG
jgi:hypothetical protein